MSNKQAFNPERRQTLRGLATAPAVAAAVAVTSGSAAAAPAQPASASERTKGYQVTPHVQAYYRTAAL
ncbi:MAG: formate dehydrogenase [Burkholderiales bacterium]|nr:MAG: formate dehydrogenase [Burkholderiales bacterium]